jgi:hypothetical protein
MFCERVCKSPLTRRIKDSGRGERIRTSGLLVPNQALYQAEPRPAALQFSTMRGDLTALGLLNFSGGVRFDFQIAAPVPGMVQNIRQDHGAGDDKPKYRRFHDLQLPNSGDLH